jgi:hypothetical protein
VRKIGCVIYLAYNSPGRNVVKGGKRIIKAKTISITYKNGRQALNALKIGVLAMWQDIISVVPTGGVNKPTDNEVISTNPYCTGATPTTVATGVNTAPRSMRAGATSMNIPIKRQMTETTARTATSCTNAWDIQVAICCGMN